MPKKESLAALKREKARLLKLNKKVEKELTDAAKERKDRAKLRAEILALKSPKTRAAFKQVVKEGKTLGAGLGRLFKSAQKKYVQIGDNIERNERMAREAERKAKSKRKPTKRKTTRKRKY